VEFVRVFLRKGGAFPQAVQKMNNADDLNGRNADSNGFLRRVPGQIKGRILFHDMANELFPREALGQGHIDDVDTTP
jgi:hypothetical protein